MKNGTQPSADAGLVHSTGDDGRCHASEGEIRRHDVPGAHGTEVEPSRLYAPARFLLGAPDDVCIAEGTSAGFGHPPRRLERRPLCGALW